MKNRSQRMNDYTLTIYRQRTYQRKKNNVKDDGTYLFTKKP